MEAAVSPARRKINPDHTLTVSSLAYLWQEVDAGRTKDIIIKAFHNKLCVCLVTQLKVAMKLEGLRRF